MRDADGFEGVILVEDVLFSTYLNQGAELRRLHTGMTWAEGPVYFPKTRSLIFSDVPSNTMWKWTEENGAQVFRQPSNFCNGNTRDRQGRLVSCEQGTRRVARTEANGDRVGLADSYEGRRLNSPNDVVVKSDGTIWFTDPDYGILSDEQGYKADSEIGSCWVFRYDPLSEELTVVATDLAKPNGLAFSVDETVLYVSDSAVTHDPQGPRHLKAFDVVDSRTLECPRVLMEVEPGWPDGFRVDENDNLWVTSAEGIHCYAPDGRRLGRVMVPEISANCEFGGVQGTDLFITASSSLYVLPLSVRGAIVA